MFYNICSSQFNHIINIKTTSLNTTNKKLMKSNLKIEEIK